jgi:hypothetical protein
MALCYTSRSGFGRVKRFAQCRKAPLQPVETARVVAEIFFGSASVSKEEIRGSTIGISR